MSRMLQNYQFLVGNDPNRRYPRGVETLDDLVTSIVNEVVGNAGIDLDSISELADAIGNDPQFLLTLQNNDAATASALGVPSGQQDMGTFADPDLPDASDLKVVLEAIGAAAGRLRDGLGVAAGDSDMGTFTGSTIPDNSSVKAALQALETTLEAVDLDTDDFAALVGLAENVTNLGTFAGTTLSDGLNVKGALQEIETAIENAGVGDVATEAAARIAADDAIDARLDVLEADPTTATDVAAVQADVDQNEADADAAIAQEITDRQAGDAALDTRLLVLEADPTTQTALTVVADAVAQEVADRTLADVGHDGRITALEADPVTKTYVDAADTALDGRLQPLEADPVTKTYVDTEIAGFVDAAPATLDTLNELAAALGDDPNFATTITNTIGNETTNRTAADNALSIRLDALEADPTTATAVNANETHIDNLVILSGLAKDSTNLGTFSGDTILDNRNVRQALQDLETSFENFDIAQGVADITNGTTNFTGFKLQGTSVLATGAELNYVDGVTSNIQTQINDANTAAIAVGAANEVHIDNLVTLSGVAKDATELGTFTGAVIADNVTIKTALQALETEVEQVQTNLNATQADVDQNESDADAAIALKADIASPTFTGTPAAPTAGAGTNTTQLATTAFVATAVANVIDSAPGALDTLNELAAALGDDANFSTTITNSIAAVQADVDQNELDADNAIALKLDASAASAFGLTLIDDADAAAARTTLGVDAAGTDNSTDVTIAAGLDYVTLAGQELTLGSVDLTTDVTGTLPAANGGTGVTSLAALKSGLSLDNVDNTADADKPISTATQTALDLKAPLASPALTGVPTAPTAAADTSTTQIATTAYVQTELTDLINGAPAGLQTLGEIAEALNDDSNAITNLTTLVNANTDDVADLRSVTGSSDGDINLGAFGGGILTDNATIKTSLQELSNEIEANHTAAATRTALGIGEYVDDAAAGVGGVASGAMYYNTTSSDYRLKS